MQHWKLILAYDGSPFHGWQVQPHLPTVQGTLAAALHRLTREHVLPQGSGRTDTGVHALAQVATFALAAPIPPANLLRALNRTLPPAIRVLSAGYAPPTFHARHSALRKTYQYRIFPRLQPAQASPADPALASQTSEPTTPALPRTHPDPICPPFLAPYAWDCPWPISLSAARQAATHILGCHDFTSFAASDPDLASRDTGDSASTPVRTITHSAWHEESGLLLYTVTGSGFLHHMVRNLVGTFVEAAAGRRHPDSIPHILAARNRAAAGPTAPAQGLFLLQVEYPESANQPAPPHPPAHLPSAVWPFPLQNLASRP